LYDGLDEVPAFPLLLPLLWLLLLVFLASPGLAEGFSVCVAARQIKQSEK